MLHIIVYKNSVLSGKTLKYKLDLTDNLQNLEIYVEYFLKVAKYYRPDLLISEK